MGWRGCRCCGRCVVWKKSAYTGVGDEEYKGKFFLFVQNQLIYVKLISLDQFAMSIHNHGNPFILRFD